jgi:hypothetical protein
MARDHEAKAKVKEKVQTISLKGGQKVGALEKQLRKVRFHGWKSENLVNEIDGD